MSSHLHRNKLAAIIFFLLLTIGLEGFPQQILWTKLYQLPKADDIRFITQDQEGNMYAGGRTDRNTLGPPGAYEPSILYKLTPDGDTLYSKYLGYYGYAQTAICDFNGNLKIGITQQGPGLTGGYTILLQMTPDGFIFKRDSVQKRLSIRSSMVGKDSSWILVGTKINEFNGNWLDGFFLRVQKDGTIDSYVTLNPNHPDCGADRVEQLPNGKYLVSGHVGSRIAAYTLDPDGSNVQYEQWYQTPDLSFLYSGHVSRINSQRYMIAAEGGPSVVGQCDSLLNKYWLKKEVGTQIPPQAMTDGSVVFGYSKGFPPYQVFYRVGVDSSYIWNMPIRDSLVTRGYWGNLRLKCFTYFEDESAVVAGYYNDGNATTAEDPFFIKISNVGTPVTSLSKPKRGPLKNETLAPWPNPTGGTLYLKQHFDMAEVRLYNLAGREVGQYNIHFGQPIDVSAFPAGVYLYRAVIDGKPFSGKIIKQ